MVCVWGVKMKPIICWFSGGVTSAVASKLAIELFGAERCRVVMIDTKNEHADTYRFKADCEKWYEMKIETISAIPQKYNCIDDVWTKYKALNNATGAICSTELKREVRLKWQKRVVFEYQVFGFEFTKRECNRALAMALNWPESRPIFPLLMYGLDKKDCIKIVENAGIDLPVAYQMGFLNNNCLQTGCVQGGIGYWQHMRKIQPDVFDQMAAREHRLTDIKGVPVTICKDQSEYAQNALVFLKKHPDYPELRELSDFKAKKIKPLTDCNGFCGLDDLQDIQPTDQIAIKF